MTRFLIAALTLVAFLLSLACSDDDSADDGATSTPRATRTGTPDGTTENSAPTPTPPGTASLQTREEETRVSPPTQPPATRPPGSTVATPTPVPPTGSGGATNLAAPRMICSTSRAGTVAVTFRWQPAAPAGERQRVDLSFFNNSFYPGSFLASEPLGGSASSLRWEGLAPLTIYRWRVVTYVGAELRASETAQFEAIGCGADTSG